MFIGIWTYLPYNGIYSVKILMAKNSRDIFLEAANTLLAAGYISNTLTSPVNWNSVFCLQVKMTTLYIHMNLTYFTFQCQKGCFKKMWWEVEIRSEIISQYFVYEQFYKIYSWITLISPNRLQHFVRNKCSFLIWLERSFKVSQPELSTEPQFCIYVFSCSRSDVNMFPGTCKSKLLTI